ncbi:MAG: glycosyltransferase family 2 protein, partial [Candidatus Sericytochromatia bacterium]
MASISICTIVKNEELNLHKMLESIKEIADEIIVIDTGSTDKTIEIAKSYGSIVFDFNWIDDFSSARNFSISKATKNFIFILDADEVVVNAIKIKEQLNKELDFLYMIKVINPNYEYDLNFNSKIHYTSKIFKNNNLFQYKGCIHEALVPVQNIQVNRTLLRDVEIIHSGYFGENKPD